MGLEALALVRYTEDGELAIEPTIYYRLTEHDFIGRLREEYFGAWAN